MNKLISAAAVIGLLSACDSQGSLGKEGSPYWFARTSIEEQSRYFAAVCQGYGHQGGTNGLRDCVAEETRTQKASNKDDMDSAMESMFSRPEPSTTPAYTTYRAPTTTTCRSSGYGNSITCNSY